MDNLSIRIIEVIKEIPFGIVLSYKEVGELAGHHNAARQVARILASSSSKYDLPWWRVVSSKMEVSIKDPVGRERQIALLKAEGVSFNGNKIVRQPN